MWIEGPNFCYTPPTKDVKCLEDGPLVYIIHQVTRNTYALILNGLILHSVYTWFYNTVPITITKHKILHNQSRKYGKNNFICINIFLLLCSSISPGKIVWDDLAPYSSAEKRQYNKKINQVVIDHVNAYIRIPQTLILLNMEFIITSTHETWK